MKKLALILAVVLIPAVTQADRIAQTIEQLSSPAFKVRATAALVLGTKKKHRARAVRPLMKALRDNHAAVRAAAAAALGKLGAVGSLGALSQAMSDGEVEVARAARRAIGKVVSAFVADRGGRFEENHYNFYIKGLMTEARFKDMVMERLLAYDNIDVGAPMVFDGEDDEVAPIIELDLRGEITSISQKGCTMRVTLALKKGDYVVTEWKQLQARGASRDEALAQAARLAVTNVLAYLGAK